MVSLCVSVKIIIVSGTWISWKASPFLLMGVNEMHPKIMYYIMFTFIPPKPGIVLHYNTGKRCLLCASKLPMMNYGNSVAFGHIWMSLGGILVAASTYRTEVDKGKIREACTILLPLEQEINRRMNNTIIQEWPNHSLSHMQLFDIIMYILWKYVCWATYCIIM